jgi:hypothetical protein
MDIGELMSQVVQFFYSHMYIAIFLCVCLGILAYLKPKSLIKVIVIVLILTGVVYLSLLIMDMTSGGKHQKEDLIIKSIE